MDPVDHHRPRRTVSAGAEQGTGCRLVLRGKVLPLDRSLVMAVVNRTPDSFFDRGRTYALGAALDRVEQVVAEGADIVDVGGVKAGPGEQVSAEEEARRVIEVVEAVRERHPEVALSVDTYRSKIADLACRAGADLVNDSWQAPDARTAQVAAAHGAGLVCTHAGGQPPRTRPHRAEHRDVVDDVVGVLDRLARRAVAAGVAPESVLVDPGHDFGKNSRHSLALTRGADRIAATGWPVLMALSRKDFVGEVLNLPPEDRLEGTLAATAVASWLGARVFRAHDVAATVRVLAVVDAIAGRRELAVALRGLA
jgi:dihydropteroate synthase